MAAAFKVEKGVPFATPSSKYPWAEMEVGDSFFVPNPTKYFQSQVSNAGRLHRRKFRMRHTEGGARVWRVA